MGSQYSNLLREKAMKRLTRTAALLAVGITALGSADAQAQVFIGPYVGYNLDAEEVYFGANVYAPLPVVIGKSQLVANPGFDYYPFIDNATLWALNLDVLYPIPVESPSFTPYIGSGLLIQRVSIDIAGISASETDVGLNLRGGSMFGTSGPVKPFAEAVLVIADESGLLLKGGVYIEIGG
jgi:hypothetical protein